MSHKCPECDRVHQSEAEERAEQEAHVRRMRAIRARLLWGLERVPRDYTREELADYLTGCVSLTVIGGLDDDPAEPQQPTDTAR